MMNWHSWSEFAHMGGYGLYVWGTFAVAGVTFCAEMVQLRLRRDSMLEAMRQAEEGQDETA